MTLYIGNFKNNWYNLNNMGKTMSLLKSETASDKEQD